MVHKIVMATTNAATVVGVVSPPQHPSSTLVNISDDANARLISILAPGTSNPAKFEKSCTDAISNGNAAKLLSYIISHGAVTGLLKDDTYTTNEVVNVINLLTVYLDRVDDVSVASELCGALADAVGKVSSDDSNFKEKQSAMVAALFNLRSNANEKVMLLSKVIELGDTSTLVPGEPRGTLALADMIDPTNLTASLKLWGDVDNVNLRTLYSALSKGMDRVLEKLAKDEQEDKTTVIKIKVAKEWKQSYMLALLDTYKDASQLDDGATSTAREAAIYAIRDPINLFATQRRILSIPAITSLSKSHAPLYDLLKIFMEGKLQDYRDFTSMPDKASVFTTYGLSEQECMKNMCLLSLVSLASEHEEIPYSAIASTLSINEDEVEQWVIKAVSSGLMEAKMDQLRKVVLVERCAVRQFGMKEWSALKVRLDTWKVNVKGVLDALEKSGAVGVVES